MEAFDFSWSESIGASFLRRFDRLSSTPRRLLEPDFFAQSL
jgi:hypothetical protein